MKVEAPAPPQVACDHCGLPVPSHDIEHDSNVQFCCSGCRVVYHAIRDSGLSQFYELQDLSNDDRLDANQVRAITTDRTYEEYDHPCFEDHYVRPLLDGEKSSELFLSGVHCAACLWLVERVGRSLDGVSELRLDLGRSKVSILWDPETTSLSKIARRLDEFGYPSRPYKASAAREAAQKEDRSLLIRLAIAGACAGNVMLLSFALYGGLFHGIDRVHETLFRWASLGISMPSIIFGGGVFFQGALQGLKQRVLAMDLPISIGLLVGFTGGAINTFRNEGDIYFDSVTALVFLLLVGRFIQRRQQRRAIESVEWLGTVLPSSARQVEGSEVHEVPLEAIKRGDLVEVRAGDSIPIDGVIHEGSSTLDRSILSGESRPIRASVGDQVFAGTVNVSGRLVVEVQETGVHTRMARLMTLIGGSKPKVVELADRISGWFVATVMILAVITLALWISEGVESAAEHAVALLVVTCPCALGLATPLAVAAAIGRAARAGILIKGGDLFSRLERTKTLWLDKTGTLTEGKMKVIHTLGDKKWLRVAASLESQVVHPIAHAFTDIPRSEEHEVSEVEQVLGRGVTGVYEGRRIAMGSPAWIETLVGDLTEEQLESVERWADLALTPLVVSWGDRPVGAMAIGDPIRPSAKPMIEAMVDRGFRVGILSGDDERCVRATARRVGIDLDRAHGGASPEMKADFIRRESEANPVIMVGDGVNDSAALAYADVGIAVHGGAEAALESADVYMTSNELDRIPFLIRSAHDTVGVIKRNLVFSLAYNALGASLAMLGWINPLVAAVLMPISSITVITSSYRTRSFQSS